MAAQNLEKWLKGAVNQAPQGWTVNLDFADAGREHYLISKEDGDETDLQSVCR